MSTTTNILGYLWGSTQLQAAFIDFAEKKGDPTPSLHEMFQELVRGMSIVHRDWYVVTVSDTGPQFALVEHTPEDWDREVAAMNQDIADMVAKRLLGDV